MGFLCGVFRDRDYFVEFGFCFFTVFGCFGVDVREVCVVLFVMLFCF